MERKLVVEFTKMNGAGNDFIVVDNRFFHFSDEELREIARRYCPRRIGIGADGLLALASAQEEENDYRMRYLNADGSIGTMCGNGARCLARFARNSGIGGEEMRFESDAGLYRVRVPDDLEAPVVLFVQPPRNFMPDRQLSSRAAQEAGPLHYIWTGVEHLVCFVKDIEKVPVTTWGREIRSDEMLGAAGANVNFVQVVEENDGTAVIKARTYEKGVEAETLACGTGALASGIIAHLLGYVKASRIDVEMPGGVLGVGFEKVGSDITDLFLEGPAKTVYRGTFEF